MNVYRSMLPQIVFALQNMELYHHCEKRLFGARGLLAPTTVRSPTWHPDRETEEHIDLVLSEVLRQGLPRAP